VERRSLRTTGPYAVTRHPIYTGLLGMLVGTGLLGGGWTLALAVVAAAYITFKARAEERLMTDTFGARYAAYRRRTPRLVPWPRPRQTADPDPPPRPSS
jgi:protein-S-isoprenylcysteine O-methyltransferase Ste14